MTIGMRHKKATLTDEQIVLIILCVVALAIGLYFVMRGGSASAETLNGTNVRYFGT